MALFIPHMEKETQQCLSHIYTAVILHSVNKDCLGFHSSH